MLRTPARRAWQTRRVAEYASVDGNRTTFEDELIYERKETEVVQVAAK
jgi:hypothetical protein